MSDEAPVEKRCTKCGEVKPIDAFYKKGGKQKGYETHCKACKSQSGKAHYAANAEAICKHQHEYRAANIEMLREREAESRRLYMQKYRHANGEILREQQRARRQANPDKYRQQGKAWRTAHAVHLREYVKTYGATYRAANPEKFREYNRQYREANKEKIIEFQRQYHINNPDATRIKHARRRARMEGIEGHFTIQEIHDMRIAQAGICAYCQRQYDPNHLEIEHIIPVAQGGSDDIFNICLACPTCNRSKGNRTPGQWINRWYERKPKDL